MKFTISHEVTEQQIAYALGSALEGGSHYWISEVRCEGLSEDLKTLNLPAIFKDEDGKTHRVTLTDIRRGLVAMARQKPHKFADLFPRDENEGDWDQNDADKFLQFCVFGKLVYG